jgi:hypothetical protein
VGASLNYDKNGSVDNEDSVDDEDDEDDDYDDDDDDDDDEEEEGRVTIVRGVELCHRRIKIERGADPLLLLAAI